MSGIIFTEKILSEFRIHLKNEEKSAATVEKYLRDARAFIVYVNQKNVDKEIAIAYKKLLWKIRMQSENTSIPKPPSGYGKQF